MFQDVSNFPPDFHQIFYYFIMNIPNGTGQIFQVSESIVEILYFAHRITFLKSIPTT